MVKVMVVDDNKFSRQLLSKKLQAKGCEILQAADGQECIDKVAAFGPDVILLDMRMPGISGMDAAKILKGDDTTKEIPIIGLSANSEAAEIQLALDSGCDTYETKPFQFDTLWQKISDYAA